MHQAVQASRRHQGIQDDNFDDEEDDIPVHDAILVMPPVQVVQQDVVLPLVLVPPVPKIQKIPPKTTKNQMILPSKVPPKALSKVPPKNHRKYHQKYHRKYHQKLHEKYHQKTIDSTTKKPSTVPPKAPLKLSTNEAAVLGSNPKKEHKILTEIQRIRIIQKI
jgi:hypothetical protein